ncbi:MAG: hypothetical protein LBK99_04580 [Opitutaceae bacterium]|jgi:hypothetical protein|nr:hypothetical protein [Opitutaceae bacterium]
MKKTQCLLLLLPFAACLCSQVAAQQLALEGKPPASGAALLQASVADGGVSVRYLHEGERRGASQTFVWNFPGKLTGLGLKISSDAAERYPLAQPQRFEIDIHELTDALTGRKIVRKLATIPVSLTPSLARPGCWLQITLDTPLELKNGVPYGLHLRPVEIVDENHLYLAWSGHGTGTTTYKEGVASLTLGTAYADGDGYGREPLARDFDLAFYLTTNTTGNRPE